MKHAYLLAALFGAAAVQANPTVETNGILTNRDGRTLYTFDKDSASKSNCNGSCLAAWPAFTVANASLAGGDFSVVVRDDGTQQWAFQGKPLYFFCGRCQARRAQRRQPGRRLACAAQRSEESYAQRHLRRFRRLQLHVLRRPGSVHRQAERPPSRPAALWRCIQIRADLVDRE